MIQHQFFLLIHIIYCAVTIHGILLNANDAETCNLLCVQCNASAVFANNECECNFAENSDKDLDMECMQRVQSELQDIEQNMLYEDLTDEERNARSISRYNRRLRHGIVYPTHEEYDPHMMNSIIRPNKLPLYRIAFTPVTIPDYGIHQMLYPHVYHSEYQRGLLRSSNPLSDKYDTIVGQSCEDNEDSTNDDSKISAARNARKEVELVLNQSRYPLFSQALYKLNPYYPYPLMYNPYNYYYPHIPRHAQHYSDPQISATNLQSLCENNVNTEGSAVQTTNKPVYFNDGTEKIDNTKNNIPKEKSTL
ncbi:hypothetical protein PUN28_016118 [Cardiocondyla obscurior]|uniref:Uncharacterized protein n=1 Tax=Cardiocondyla obscurior TaxID=286306 RepID=A0AAW2ETF1_9HYME